MERVAETLPVLPLNAQLLMVSVPAPPGTACVSPMPDEGLVISLQNSD